MKKIAGITYIGRAGITVLLISLLIGGGLYTSAAPAETTIVDGQIPRPKPTPSVTRRTRPVIRRYRVRPKAKRPLRFTPRPTPRPRPIPVPSPIATIRTKLNPIDGAEMIWIPTGEFIRGSKYDGTPGSDPEADAHEKPQQRVYLSGYWIYKYPVTVKQFRKFTQENSYEFDWEGRRPDWGWLDDHPMVCVSWNEAKAYCDWAKVQLPTEAQFEKAARGTTGRKYSWGNSYDDAKLWCSVTTPRSRTASVYRTENVSESPFGCVDMSGNVWQWCSDWYKADYYKTAPLRDPIGPKYGEYRVLRGGSWYDDYIGLFRTAGRDQDGPLEVFYGRAFRAASTLP